MDTLHLATIFCLWLYFVTTISYHLSVWMKRHNKSPLQDLVMFILFLLAALLTSNWLFSPF